MEDYRLTQSGQEVQNILDGAAMQVDLTAETERATDAEQTLQGNIDAEETRAEGAEGTLQDNIDAEETRAQGAEGTLQDNIDAEETRAKAAEKQNADDIDAIEEKIPSGASSSNKLTTEEYVNDSVATATATFRGTYNVVTDLSLLPSATHSQISASLKTEIATADNNDYAFVQIPTSVETPEEIEKIERYKYNGSVWGFEYVLNNSGFTAAQWAAINSGITSNAVGKLDALPNNAELTILLNGKQDTLTFDNVPTQGSSNPVKSGGAYSAIKSEETRAMAAESQNANGINALNALVPAGATSENKLATIGDVDEVSSAIEAILLLIPSAASALNQLADKAFLNSSIATATATFRGTYNLVTDLSLNVNATHSQIAGALGINISTADNNDYAFVQIPTSIETPTEIRVTERYKFNGTSWAFEYDLNNSGFTSAQWAAINSGITIALVGKLNGLPTNAELTTLLNGKQDTLTFDNVPTQGSTNPVKSSGIYNVIKAITDLIPAEATAQNQLADKADVAAKIVAAIPSWKGQYDALTDLQAVTGAKAGDMGCVKTTDSDGHAVLTFYQYSAQGAWVVYYTLRHYAQNKPATTGTTGDYPYNGMGRIELQKNIVNGVNTLTQAMLTQQNTIYVIQYDFTLASDVTIPANCILEFDGGSISDGTIQLSDGCVMIDESCKVLNNNLYVIVGNNCKLYGINLFVEFEQNKEIILCDNKTNVSIEKCSSVSEYASGAHHYSKGNLVINNGSSNVSVVDSYFEGNIRQNDDGEDGNSAPILVLDCSKINLIRCSVEKAQGDGIILGNTKHSIVKDCFVDMSDSGWSGIVLGASPLVQANCEWCIVDGCTVIAGVASAISFNASNSILTNSQIKGSEIMTYNAIALGHPSETQRVHNSIISNCIIERNKDYTGLTYSGIEAYINGNVVIDNVQFLGTEHAAIGIHANTDYENVIPSAVITNCYFKNSESCVKTKERDGLSSNDLNIEIKNCVSDKCTDFVDVNSVINNLLLSECTIKGTHVTNNTYFANTLQVYNNEITTSDVVFDAITGASNFAKIKIENNIFDNNSYLIRLSPDRTTPFKEWIISDNRFKCGDNDSLIFFSGTYNTDMPLVSFINNVIDNVNRINIIVTRGTVQSGVTLTPAFCQFRNNILLNTSTDYNNSDVIGAYKTLYKSGNVVGGVVEGQS